MNYLAAELTRYQDKSQKILYGTEAELRGIEPYFKINEAESLLATDYFAEMVAQARIIFQHQPDISIEQVNCHGTQYADGSFDTVLMANLIHVIDEPLRALQEAHRLLKKNGALLLTCFTTEKMPVWRKLHLLYRYCRAFGPFPQERTPFTSTTLGDMVTEAGFDVQETCLLGTATKSIFLKALKI